MDLAVNLFVAALIAISAALVVARIRARRQLEETTRKLVESRREFGESIERLSRIVSEDSDDAEMTKIENEMR